MSLCDSEEGRRVAPHLEMNARDLSIAHGETYGPLWPTPGKHHHTLLVLDR